MGFLDKLFNAAKIVSEITSEIDPVSEKADAVPAQRSDTDKKSEYMKVEPAKPSVCYSDTFYDGEEVETEVEYSFMISGDFVWRKNNAAEVDALFVYAPDGAENEKVDFNNTPYIFVSGGDDTIYMLVEEFKEKGTVDGLIEKYENRQALFKCRTDYYGQVMVLYGMDRGTIWENSGIALVYNKSVEGTPLEEKLIKILDEAAETYTEKIVN